MNKKQEKLVDETVRNYREMDDLKADIKDETNSMMTDLAKYIKDDKNYQNFIDNTDLVLAMFTEKFMEKHGGKFTSAIELGNKLGSAINAVTT